MSTIQLSSEHGCYGGVQQFFQHESRETRGPMKFSAYLPPQSRTARVPVLYYLAGLTCTEETFPIKAHAQQLAAELGLMLVSPDTSPREPRVPGDADSWDFGQAAGFYVDATQPPWSANYRMYSYVTRELPEIVTANLPALADAAGIFGHSMGGHGALMCALRNPSRYRSVSAFAPIAAPQQCPWGQKAFHRLSRREPPGLARVRRYRMRVAHDFSRAHPDRSGHRGSISVGAAARGEIFSGGRQVGPDNSICACSRATTTATTSSKPSWPIICATTRLS